MFGGKDPAYQVISAWLHRLSKTWVAASALTVFLLFSVLVLPAQSAQAEAYSSEAGSPDMSFFYSPSDLYAMAEAYGERGRMAYVRARFTFDLIWPLVYALFLSTTISWVSARTFAAHSPWRPLNIVPVVGALLDYLENVSTSVVMMRYPSEVPLSAALAPVFTVTKWLLIGASFTALIAVGLVGAWGWASTRGR